MAIKIVCLGLPGAGPARANVELEGTQTVTLRELVTDYLTPRFGYDLANLLFEGSGLAETYIVLVNGRNVLGLDNLETVIGDDAEVLITPPVGGG